MKRKTVLVYPIFAQATSWAFTWRCLCLWFGLLCQFDRQVLLQGNNPGAGSVEVLFFRGLLMILRKPSTNGQIEKHDFFFFFFLLSCISVATFRSSSVFIEASSSLAWDWLSLFFSHKLRGTFSVQAFFFCYILLLLFYYLTVLCSIHYTNHFCSPVLSFACLWLKNIPFT